MTRHTHTIVALLLLILTASCDTQKQDSAPLTIAISPWPGYSFALLALDLGYLKKNNKNQIKFTLGQSLNESLTSYENGNVDGMFSTMIEVIESTQLAQKKPNIVLVTNISNGPDQILATKNIKTLQDLKGKKIAVEQSSIGMYMLNRALKINNIPASELILAHMNSEHMEKALKEKMVDAVITYPPYIMANKKLAPNIIFHSGMIHNEIVDVLSIEKEAIERNPEKVKLLIKGWFQAYKNNPEKANEIIGKYPGFSHGNLSQALTNIELPDYNNQLKLFSPDGILKHAYKNIIKQINGQSALSIRPDNDKIINKKILQLYPNTETGKH